MSARGSSSSGSNSSPGAKQHGVSYILAEIDPETLPEEEPWAEVRRRIAAKRAGRDGWRTGEIESRLEEFAGGEGDG